MLNRMVSISKLRTALDKRNSDILIHIFGSLDPVSTPLYFLSGADIFDGLTWLRYAYHDGVAIYRHNFLACGNEIALRTPDGELSAAVHVRNYHALGHLEENMRQFLSNGDFDVFGWRAKFFQDATEKLWEEIKGQINGR